MVGIGHGNEKIFSTTAAHTHRSAGALRAGLLLCEFQKNKRSLQGNRFNASFLKMTVIPIGFFYTSLAGKAHKVIAKYDKRAYVENLVDEVKREGLDAVPSGRFKNNYAFFQIVMLAYNIWRYMKIMDHKSIDKAGSQMQGIMTNTIRIARLKLLFIAAKAVKDGGRDKVKYSIHDARTIAIMKFLKFLDRNRAKVRPWEEDGLWPQRFAIQPV